MRDSGTAPRNGHHRSAHRTAEPLAEDVCRKTHRFHSAECLDHVMSWERSTCEGFCAATLNITKNRVFTCRWARILPAPALGNGRRLEPLWRLRRVVACITATNGVRRKGVLERVESHCNAQLASQKPRLADRETLLCRQTEGKPQPTKPSNCDSQGPSGE